MLEQGLSSEKGDDHRDNPHEEQVFSRYIEAAFLFTLRSLQVDF
jgi:hypothetical protein